MSPSKPSKTKRPKGDGAVFQRCDIDRGCPPTETVTQTDGTVKRVRPEHTCHGMWIARLDLGSGPDGKPRRPQRASATKNGAKAKLQEMKDQYAKHGDVATTNPTVATWLTTWLKDIVRPRNDPGTFRTYRTAVTQHLIPGIGKHRLERLTPAHVRELYKNMAKTGTTGMRPSVHRTLRKALNDAIPEGYVGRNVAQLIDAPGGKGTKRIALTGEEGLQLIRHVSQVDENGRPLDRYFARWGMALLTAARQGECLGLERDRVDLEANVMDVSWKLERIFYAHGCGEEAAAGDTWPCGRKRAGSCPDRYLAVPDKYEYRQLHGGLCLTRPKTESSTRLLSIPPPFHAALTFHFETDTGPNPHGLVWREPDGRPIDLPTDTNRWDALLRAAGLPDVVLHEARNTTITLLMEAGVDPTVIQQIAGHSNLVMQERYKHVDTRHMAEALGKIAGQLYLEQAKP